MIPLALDPQYLQMAVAGNGELALRRLRALRRAGATEILLFADAPIAELSDEAGAFLRPRMPVTDDLASLHVVWIVDVADDVGTALAQAARKLRVLVNFEDRPSACDFHSVAEVRRGDLLLTVSTNGAAPGLAGSIRKNLENCFGPEWDERVAEVAKLRAGWRAEGVKMSEAAKRIDALVEESCWVACKKPAPVAQV